MMRQTLQPSLIASGSGRTILIAGGERGVIYRGSVLGLSAAVWRKAQQYGVWPEVRRWAKEHPLAVPFVNQDTDMIHSIAQTGWTRWIKGDGVAYLGYTNVPLSKYIGFKTLAYSNKNGTNTNVSSTNSSGRVGMSFYSENNLYVLHYETTYHVARFPETHNVPRVFSMNVDYGKFYIDGVLRQSWNWTANPSGNTFKLFGPVEVSNSNAAYVEFINNQTKELVANFIPHRTASGECGMVDVISGTFYPNANTTGSFTIDLTPNQ